MLAPWANFFVLTGSAAAALTGLMFVVITLVAGTNRQGANPTGLSTFSTPTVLHFSTALVASTVLCAPWSHYTVPSVILGLASIAFMIHMMRVIVRVTKLDTYRADLEDWIWFNALPLITYLLMAIASVMLFVNKGDSLFIYGSAIVLLLVIGIHNAWDVVTYLAVQSNEEEEKK